MPVYGESNSFGDLYVQWQINVPENLTEEEKRLFEELRKKRQGRFSAS
jgi:curved DNA-binding protein